MPSIELTPDAWDLVVDHLDHTSLKALALTCKEMVSPCRRNLFSSIILDHREPFVISDLIINFHKLITENHAIIHYVRHFEHRIWWPDSSRVPEIFEIMCTSSTLRSVKLRGDLSTILINGDYGKRWNGYSETLQTAMEHLIHMPSLTTLFLSSMESVPTSIFFNCTHITHITLQKIMFVHDEKSSESATTEGVISALKPIFLFVHVGSFEGLQVLMRPSETAGKTSLIDFSRLRDVAFSVYDATDFDVVGQVLQLGKAVESMAISTSYQQISWAGFGRSLATSAVGTLRRLKVETFAGSRASNPLGDLLQELETIAGKNTLEEFILKPTMYTSARCWVDTDDWSAFECFLTTPGSFPKLKVVTVNVLWYASVAGVRQEDIIDRVKEGDFPKLLESSDLEFRFSNELY